MWTLLDLHLLYNSPTATSSPLSLIVLVSFLTQTILIFSLLTAEVLCITNPSCSCLWLALPFLRYAVKQHVNNAVQYFNIFIKMLSSLSIFRFAVFFEARLLNTIMCNDAWIKVT